MKQQSVSCFAAVAIAALVLPAIAVPTAALPRKDEWLEVRSANFTLFSNAGESNTRRIAGDLERLRDALGQLAPGVALSSPTPTYIFVFKDAGSFRPYLRSEE